MEGFTPWPDDVARDYRAAGYWRGETLGDLFRAWAGRFGDREALATNDARLSYRALDEAADRLAHNLLRIGLAAGDRVVVQLPNINEFAVLSIALFRIGAIPVMALPAHRGREISYLIDFSGATAYAIPARLRGFDFQHMARQIKGDLPGLKYVLVAGGEAEDGFLDLGELIAQAVDAAAARAELDRRKPDPSSVALFLLSGGTTGLPKLIPRTHDDYAYNIRVTADLCGFGSDTVYMASLPVAHNFPLGCPGMFGALMAGGRVVMAPSPRADAALPLIENERVTVTAVVPAIAIQWMDGIAAVGADLSSLETLQVGGARINPEAARRVRPLLGCTLQQVFGMAEGLLNYTRLDDADEVIVNTQGRPASDGDEILIVGADGRPVAAGEAGELLTRGPYTLRGYYKADDHNRRAFTPDGFYRTGDIVRLHPSGNLMVEGREKDFINRGGEKISAEEIENLILGHGAVGNVAAVAMPDRIMGERICVYVELNPGRALDLGELRDFMAATGIAAFKLPERIETIAGLPLTNIGKIDKKALRRDIAARLAAETGG